MHRITTLSLHTRAARARFIGDVRHRVDGQALKLAGVTAVHGAPLSVLTVQCRSAGYVLYSTSSQCDGGHESEYRRHDSIKGRSSKSNQESIFCHCRALWISNSRYNMLAEG